METQPTKKIVFEKMKTLKSIQEVTALANELGRKVSKNDLNERFNCVWCTDKQGRAQTLCIGDDFFRSDNAAFYPGGVKPESSGKHLTSPRQNDKLQKSIDFIKSYCEAKNVKLGLASQLFEKLLRLQNDEREAAILEATLKEAAQIEKLEAKIAQYNAILAAKKAAM